MSKDRSLGLQGEGELAESTADLTQVKSFVCRAFYLRKYKVIFNYQVPKNSSHCDR